MKQENKSWIKICCNNIDHLDTMKEFNIQRHKEINEKRKSQILLEHKWRGQQLTRSRPKGDACEIEKYQTAEIMKNTKSIGKYHSLVK